MNQAEKAGREMDAIHEMASGSSPIHRLSPGAKLLLTVSFIMIVLSFPKYQLTGLFFFVLFPVIGYQVAGIPVSTCFRKLWVVLPLVCAVGIFNPFFDRKILAVIAGVKISGGVISMLSLMLKGIFCLMASFLLVATTTIEEICAALRKIHCPKMLTALLLLTFRYVHVLLEEVSLMTDAYHLRAPHQKGIHHSAWGSFLGQLILRTADRGSMLYESMILRGFHGEFLYAENKKYSRLSWLVAGFVLLLMIGARLVDLTALLGSLL
ncbi:MAG: cobalt ECF transporter T component CbiQ [Acetatifactor sp.]|nr:cobalt ECF transporter T component CbiQ [Acetatifactor sp.]